MRLIRRRARNVSSIYDPTGVSGPPSKHGQSPAARRSDHSAQSAYPSASARATRAVKNLEKNQQKHTNEVELNYDTLNTAIDDCTEEKLKAIIETVLEELRDMPVDENGEERVVLTQAE